VCIAFFANDAVRTNSEMWVKINHMRSANAKGEFYGMMFLLKIVETQDAVIRQYFAPLVLSRAF